MSQWTGIPLDWNDSLGAYEFLGYPVLGMPGERIDAGGGYEVTYLQDQLYLQPHPKELMLRNHV